MLSKIRSTVWEVIKLALFTLVIVVPIRAYVAQPFIVSGLSMYPTFNDRQYLIVDELSYQFRSPARGEVVVFHYPKDPSKFFIKRVIGLPGETVVIKGHQVSVGQSGRLQPLTEPYLANLDFNSDTELTLGAGQYFVMGDNRNASFDSRSWGAVPLKLITGRALVRLFPPSQLSWLPGALTHYQTTP